MSEETPGSDGLVPDIHGKMFEIYSDFGRRCDLAEWQRWGEGIGDLSRYQDDVTVFLNSHFALPKAVWGFFEWEVALRANPGFRWVALLDAPWDLVADVAEFHRSGQLTADPGRYAKVRVMAYLAYWEAQWAQVMQLAQEAVARFDGDWLMYQFLGDASLPVLSQGTIGQLVPATDTAPGIAAYESALKLKPDDFHCRYWLGRLYQATGEYGPAAAAFKPLRFQQCPAGDQQRRQMLWDSYTSYQECDKRARPVSILWHFWSTLPAGTNFETTTPREVRHTMRVVIGVVFGLIGAMMLFGLIMMLVTG